MASLPSPSRARTQHLHALNPPSSRSNTASPTRGSITQTQTITQIQTDSPNGPSRTIETATLRLRGAHDPAESRRQGRRGPTIRWAEDVVDNEGLGRKSSKGSCCYDLKFLSALPARSTGMVRVRALKVMLIY